MVMRTGWERDDIYALFDASPPGSKSYHSSHQHEDKLGILLYANGKLLLTEAGTYQYNDSIERRYALSSRGHNTVLVDGMDQNHVHNTENVRMNEDSGMKWRIGDDYDSAEGEYDEGYGRERDRSVMHRRKVIFFKKTKNNSEPFFLVIDRFIVRDDNSHRYEIIWHIDDEDVTVKENCLVSANLAILPSRPEGMAVTRGGSVGWKLGSWNARPVPVDALVHTITAKSLRHITLLRPSPGAKEECILEAGSDPQDTDIRLCFNGKEMRLDEGDFIL